MSLLTLVFSVFRSAAAAQNLKALLNEAATNAGPVERVPRIVVANKCDRRAPADAVHRTEVETARVECKYKCLEERGAGFLFLIFSFCRLTTSIDHARTGLGSQSWIGVFGSVGSGAVQH